MELIAPPSIYAAVPSTMMLLANIQPPDRCGSGKRCFVFQGALAPSSARVSLDASVPNQFPGLIAVAIDHAISRAALDASDLRIGCVSAQHPEQSHG